MAEDANSPIPPLDEFESYLLLLARTQLDNSPQKGVDPCDAVQQTLVIAYEKYGQFRGRNDQELAGWLRRILANHLTDLFRRKGREFDEQKLAGRLDQSSARLAELLKGEQSTPSQRVAKSERLLMLADALRQLPDEQRRAIELRHLKGLSVAEIAEIMGKTLPSVGGFLQRGLRALRGILSEGPD